MKTLVILCLSLTLCSLAIGGTSEQREKNLSVAEPSEISTITVNGVTDIDPAKAIGTKNPVVVIEVFSDFQCPMCKQLFTTTLARVAKSYVTGANPCRIYIVQRDFPWPYHAYARLAASYARAAAHIGKCEEVEAALFQNQEKWEANGDVKGTVAGVLTTTEMKKVQSLVDAKTLEPLIERDKQLGSAIPVRGTPTMVLHTRDGKTYPVLGIVSYEELKGFLDQLLR